MPAAHDHLLDEERADLASFRATLEGGRRDLASLLAAERSAVGRSRIAHVHEFSERFLPSRGWSRVLVFAGGAGTAAILLSERGYDVTVTDPDPVLQAFVRHRLDRRGLSAEVLEVNALDRYSPSFDAIVVGAESAPRTLGRALRRGGVIVGVGFQATG